MVATVGSIQAIFRANMGEYVTSLQRGERATGQFDRRVGSYVGNTNKTLTGLQRQAALTSTAMRTMMLGMAASAAGVLAPLLSITAGLNGAKRALAEFDEIGKRAKAGALDAQAYQELAYAAELGGVSTDQFAKALETFAKNAGQAAIGKGRMVTALKQLNPELLAAIQNARTQEQRIRLVADALDRETDASRKAAIAAAAFGDAGIRMIEMLKGGSAALDETARQARNLGIVVDRDLIANAERMNDEFSTATKIIDLNFKQALISLAPILVSIAERAAWLARNIRGFTDAMRELENQGTLSLDGQLMRLGAERIEVERKILDLKREGDRLTQNARDLGFGVDTEAANADLTKLQDRMRAIAAEEEKILGILKGRQPAAPGPLPITDDIDMDTGGGSGRASSRNDAARAALAEAEAVRDLISNLEFERSLIGFTDVEKRKLNELRRLGSAATAEERAQIGNLIDAIERETQALEANQRAQEERARAIESLFQMGGDALQAIASGSEKAGDAIRKLAVQLAVAATQAALLGSGPLAGLFGGGGVGLGGGGLLSALFGGGRSFGAGISPKMPMVGLWHTGGDASNPPAYRALDALPRFHTGKSGVGHDELMAILEKSESVLTASQVDRTASALSAATAGLQERGADGGASVLQVQLSPELVGQILKQAKDQSISITRANNAARQNLYQNGGAP